jgi:transcriptional regulator with XRE-family HTH domain
MTGSQLTDSLRRLGWLQREFAARMGFDKATVSRWAHDKQPIPPHVDEYLRLAELARQMLEGKS